MFNSLSDIQIEEALAQYHNVPSIVTLLEGIKTVREADKGKALEALQAQANAEQAKVEFGTKVAKLAKLPPPPEGIYNIYLAWDMVVTPQDIPEGTSEAKIAELQANPIKTMQWVVTPNKGFEVKGNKTNTPTNSKKRLVKRIYRKNTEPLELVLDGSKVEGEPLTTWTQCIRYLNTNPASLNHNPDGSPITIIETTASGLVDLRTAGFIGIES